MLRVAVFDVNGVESPKDSISTTWYSPLAMIFAASLATAMLLVLAAFAFGRRFPADMPLATGCSASIAAACWPGKKVEKDLALKPLMWGVVDDGHFAHATFSTSPLFKLLDGFLYA